MATMISASSSVTATHAHHSAFLDQGKIPWTDWVMAGTWFKLLRLNPTTGGFTMMLKVEPNNVAPIHGHFGSVEGIILEGGFSYENDPGGTGDFVYEGAGIRHIPTTGDDGLVMFAVIHGPLGGYGEDGNIAAVVDARMMYDLAVAAGVADHLEKPSHWE